MDLLDVPYEVDALIISNKAEEALQLINSTLVVKEDELLQMTKGKVLLKLNKIEEAMSWFKKYKGSYSHFWLGAAFGQIGNKAEMLMELEKAVKTSLKNTFISYSLAQEAISCWAYQKWINDEDFLKTLNVPDSVIIDKTLAKLLELHYWGEWFKAFELSKKELSSHPDTISLVDSAIYALEMILQDFDIDGDFDQSIEETITIDQAEKYFNDYKEKRLKLSPKKETSTFQNARIRIEIGVDPPPVRGAY